MRSRRGVPSCDCPVCRKSQDSGKSANLLTSISLEIQRVFDGFRWIPCPALAPIMHEQVAGLLMCHVLVNGNNIDITCLENL